MQSGKWCPYSISFKITTESRILGSSISFCKGGYAWVQRSKLACQVSEWQIPHLIQAYLIPTPSSSECMDLIGSIILEYSSAFLCCLSETEHPEQGRELIFCASSEEAAWSRKCRIISSCLGAQQERGS